MLLLSVCPSFSLTLASGSFPNFLEMLAVALSALCRASLPCSHSCLSLPQKCSLGKKGKGRRSAAVGPGAAVSVSHRPEIYLKTSFCSLWWKTDTWNEAVP